MKLAVSVRVAGETKGSPTYHQLVQDLAQEVGGRILEGGFADYRMVPVEVRLPTGSGPEVAEEAARSLIAQMKRGMGADPRMLSGRLTVVVHTPSDDAHLERAASALRGQGYSVELQS